MRNNVFRCLNILLVVFDAFTAIRIDELGLEDGKIYQCENRSRKD
jgi:hypothetical protein